MGGRERLRGASVTAAALAYGELGWNVVPVHGVKAAGGCGCGKADCSKPGKHPRAEHGYRDATALPDAIEAAFRQAANVGIATGAGSGVWVLDVDGAEGEASLAALVARRGGLPNTVECMTGGGGRHLYFAYPEGRAVRNSVAKLAPGLDVRSEGGGAVAPPSRHASGRAYEWVAGRAPMEIMAAPAPTWLYEAMDAAAAPPAPPPTSIRSDPASDASAYAEAALDSEVLIVLRAGEGTRNDTLNKAAVKIGGLVGAGALNRSSAAYRLAQAAVGCGLPLQEANATIKSGLDFGISNPRDLAKLEAAKEERRRAANLEAQGSRRKRLRDNAAAMEWLTVTGGLAQETLDHFGFGLDKPYESPKTGKIYSDALTFPLRAPDGTQLAVFCKADVPGVTRNPKAACWSSGKEEATFHASAGAFPAVVVCDMPDVWRTWQEARRAGDGLSAQVIASTGIGAVPKEWSSPAFWDSWDAIYVATAADARGDRIARLVHRSAGKPVHRLRPPATTWRDAFAGGATVADLVAAVADATEIEDDIKPGDDDGLGRKAYRPLDIGRAFHKGNLYYPVDTLVVGIEIDKEGKVTRVEHVETVVVRSDGQQLHAVEMPSPKGTPADKRVLRLSDGTLIDSLPKAPAHPSWSWPSIEGWLAAKKRGGKIEHRPFGNMVEDVLQAFRAAIWLPYEEDYAVLALTAAASYCQAVFQALPLLLLSGEAGSGKSTAGIVMSQLSANGTIVGQVSAPAAARLIHETRGLAVLDDLESIGAKAGKDGNGFGEFVQWLKVCYNRDTATKIWVDASKNFKVERLNGFGIKVINNTTGVDSILGTRMIRVQTRKMPPSQAEARRALVPTPAERLQALRDELHAWTFDHVADIAATYGDVCPSASERSEEIAAPLRVLARLSGNPNHGAFLEAALSRTSGAAFNPDDPGEVLQEAATTLAREGYAEISPTHVILEMKRLVDAHYGQSSTTDIPEFQQPEWVGRMLRLRDILAPSEPGYRKRLFGKNLRVYPFSRHFLEEALEGQAAAPPPARAATDFCCGCSACPYRSHGCPLMAERLASEEAQQRRPVH